MYCEWSISLPTTSCCHAGHPVWLKPFSQTQRHLIHQRWSERWVHTCISASGNASPQRSRKVPSEGFIQRCSALGGNRLHWWLIYRINTKGIGFFFTLYFPSQRLLNRLPWDFVQKSNHTMKPNFLMKLACLFFRGLFPLLDGFPPKVYIFNSKIKSVL